MKILRWFLVVLLVVGLFLVRKFETELFYDPLLNYFKSDFINTPFPSIDLPKHLLSVFFRYLLNSLISLGIIYFLFEDRRMLKLSAGLMLFFFVLFSLFYFLFIKIEFQQMFTAGFYVRRILIQPMLLLVLIPAIWYYKNQEKRNEKAA